MLAGMLSSATTALKVANILENRFDIQSAHMLADVARQKGISLCGIEPDQTTADFNGLGERHGERGPQFLSPSDAILLASDLSQAGVTAAITEVRLTLASLCMPPALPVACSILIG